MNEPIHGDWGCENCTWLGSIDGNDLYFCPQHGIPTVIARYGPDHHYESGMSFAYGQSPLLTAAKELAIARGLFNEAST